MSNFGIVTIKKKSVLLTDMLEEEHVRKRFKPESATAVIKVKPDPDVPASLAAPTMTTTTM